MSLVSGYDSDGSDDDASSSVAAAAAPIAAKRSGLAAMLPPPASQAQGGGSSMQLPPPVASSSANKLTKPQDNGNGPTSAKRKNDKRQIRIGKLSDGEEEEEVQSKRAKPAVGSASGSRHGLLSMLPAPTQKSVPPKTAASEANPDLSAAPNPYGIEAASSSGAISISEADSAKKTKGNNDFRAMLGLKALAPKPKSQAKETPEDATSRDQPSSNTSALTPPPKTAAMPANNFFGLGEEQDGAARTSSERAAPRQAISLAPKVQDDEETPQEPEAEDPYDGWQQGPDGAWFPVTPAAHARLEAHLASQAEARSRLEAEARLRGINPALIQDVDVNTNLDDWLASKRKEPSSSNDKKYLAAAASVATPEQARALGLDRRTEDEEAALAEEERKRHDKSTNFRARRRGQLSSLIAQAEENKEKLEEKWAQGKANRDAARSRYGW